MSITDFLWDPVTDCVLNEYDGSGTLSVEYVTEPTFHGQLTGEVRAGHLSAYHGDGIGSTRLLTNASGNVTDTFVFDCWGNSLSRVGSTATTYQWCGLWGYQKTESAVYVRARIYRPSQGLFAQQDPVSSTAEWTYCANSPVTLVDPSGLTWEPLNKGDTEANAIRWKATAKKSDKADSLEDLAQKVSGNRDDWVCIWPDTKNVRGSKPGNADKDAWSDNYPNACCGMVADVSNLRAVEGDMYTLTVAFDTGSGADPYLRALKLVLKGKPTWSSGAKAARLIKAKSGQGKTPIRTLIIGGHGLRGAGIGNLSGERMFEAADIFAEADEGDNRQNTFDHAWSKIGPPKCWFTTNAQIYGAACNTGLVWKGEWANQIARRGAEVYGPDGLTVGVWRQAGMGNTGEVWVQAVPQQTATDEAGMTGLGYGAAAAGTQ